MNKFERITRAVTNTLRTPLTGAIFEATKFALNLEMDQESKKHLATVNEILEKERRNVIIFINHNSYADVPTCLTMVFHHLPRAKGLYGPLAISHWENTHEKILFKTLKPLGVQPLPVVRKQDEEIYGNKKSEFLAHYKEVMKRIISGRNSCVIGFAPEGTTKTDGLVDHTPGSLREAKHGMARLWEEAPEDNKPIMIPVALMYKGKGTKPFIRVGEPFDINPNQVYQQETEKEAKTAAITKFCMKKLADLLPEEMRGYYA